MRPADGLYTNFWMTVRCGTCGMSDLPRCHHSGAVAELGQQDRSPDSQSPALLTRPDSPHF